MGRSPCRGEQSWHREVLGAIVWLHALWFGSALLGFWFFPPAWLATGLMLLIVACLVWLARRERTMVAAGVVVVTVTEVVWAISYFQEELRVPSVIDVFVIGYGALMAAAAVGSLVVTISMGGVTSPEAVVTDTSTAMTYHRSPSVGRRVGNLRCFLVAVHVVPPLTFFPYLQIFWAIALLAALSLVIAMLLVWVLGRPGRGGAFAGGVLTLLLGGQALLWSRATVPEPGEELVGAHLSAGVYGLGLAIGAVWVLAVALGWAGQAGDHPGG